jgi:histidinol-phosphate aminotransferase
MNALAVRPGILDIEPYKGGESAVAGGIKAIKLSSNEGALGPSPAALEAYRKAAADLYRYPDGHCTGLRRALAQRYGLDAARIVCGAGSDELLGLLCRAYAGPGDEVLYSRHGFLIYPISARAVGATPVWAPETNLTTNVDALLAKVTARTRVLFIANPNNPTGTYLSTDELRRLRAGLRPDILLVIDAAYAEYIGRNDYTPGAELVEAHDNVVMTRTFSKIFGLGGLRLGWAYCPPDVADVLNRIRMPFNVSSAAQAAGIAALEDFAFVEKVRANNDQWHPWTAEKLRGLGIDVPDCVGNFLLLRFPRAADAAAADAFLKSRGLILRQMGGYGLPDSLRLTIGTGEEMKLVVEAFGDFMRR